MSALFPPAATTLTALHFLVCSISIWITQGLGITKKSSMPSKGEPLLVWVVFLFLCGQQQEVQHAEQGWVRCPFSGGSIQCPLFFMGMCGHHQKVEYAQQWCGTAGWGYLVLMGCA